MLSPPKFTIQPRKVRVLSLDGGGIRGIAMARILQDIEENTGKRIHELFDVIVGTSTGDLIALLLTIPLEDGKILTAKEIVQMYQRYGKIIFPPGGVVMSTPNTITYKHSEAGLLRTINDIVGSKMAFLRDAVIEVGIVTYCPGWNNGILLNSREAKIFPDSRSDIDIVTAARATSAAPTYLPELHMSLSSKYLCHSHNDCNERDLFHLDPNNPPCYENLNITLEDGGLWANCPASIGHSYASYIYGKQTSIKIFSIGTGTTNNDFSDVFIKGSQAGGGLYHVVKRMASEAVTDIFNIMTQVEKSLDDAKHKSKSLYRLQFQITEYQLNSMDDASSENLNSFKEAAERIFSHHMYAEFMNAVKKPYLAEMPLKSLVEVYPLDQQQSTQVRKFLVLKYLCHKLINVTEKTPKKELNSIHTLIMENTAKDDWSFEGLRKHFISNNPAGVLFAVLMLHKFTSGMDNPQYHSDWKEDCKWNRIMRWHLPDVNDKIHTCKWYVTFLHLAAWVDEAFSRVFRAMAKMLNDGKHINYIIPVFMDLDDSTNIRFHAACRLAWALSHADLSDRFENLEVGKFFLTAKITKGNWIMTTKVETVDEIGSGAGFDGIQCLSQVPVTIISQIFSIPAIKNSFPGTNTPSHQHQSFMFFLQKQNRPADILDSQIFRHHKKDYETLYRLALSKNFLKSSGGFGRVKHIDGKLIQQLWDNRELEILIMIIAHELYEDNLIGQFSNDAQQ